MDTLVAAVSLLFISFVCGADNIKEPPEQLYEVHSTKPGLNCIMMKAGIRLHFNYTIGNKTNYVHRDVPAGTNKTIGGVTGVCGNSTQNLTLNFNDTTLTFSFNKTGKDGKNVALAVLSYTFESAFLPGLDTNRTYNAIVTNMTQFECPAGKGFLCNANTSIDFNKTISPLVHIETIKLRVEAFRTKANNSEFDSDYTQCEADNGISNIVPIAVGAALGALVLVVLIAYLVGRKRNQRGYETV